ncbi:hypothetical protein [Pragia fontium]|uniref:hypothetical protein n=1 Tax=Pragia fontium TaxID=82985 RepID=UPI000F6FDFBE|nr:hypothetical protein [Pragia fontium]VEJ54597.1 Uncharacterised protein [Pragia fontium]
MTKKPKKFNQKNVTQRSDKPDELLMICVDKPVFGKRLASEFRKLQEQRNG